MNPLLDWNARGFDVIPLCGPRHDCPSPGKACHVNGWPDLEMFPQRLERLAAMNAGGNVGLRTKYFPAFDIDVDDPEIAAECERTIRAIVGDTAVRTRSNSARRALLYRLEGEPFKKRVVAFRSADGSASKVEVLAAGQQAVVAGVHHTGAAIEWTGGPPVAADLPAVSAGRCDELIAKLRPTLRALGCTVEGGPAALPPRRVPARAPAPETDARMAIAALRSLNPDVGYEKWLRVGMALHAKWPGRDGLELWDAWSARGEKYPGTRVLERHWGSFEVGGGVGFGTLIALARGAGHHVGSP